MLVKNYDLNFTFQMEDDFTEISKDKYSVFGVDEDSTLNYFVYIDEDDGSESGFSLIKGAKCDSVEDYEKKLLEEVNQFQELFPDATIGTVFSIQPKGGRRVDRVIIDFNDGGYLTAVYYTLVNGYIVLASTHILEDADKYEEGLLRIMLSIEEMPR